MSKKDFRYICYPYMRESASTVDYEIRTDSLTVRIGMAANLTKDLPAVHQDLMTLLPMAYHANGSVRGNLAITEEDLEELSIMYDRYMNKVRESTQTFVLPQGSIAACTLHTCRSEAKKSVRALHKVSTERDVPTILFDYLHLLANVLFAMAVYVNKKNDIQEIPFISKSYPTNRNNKKTEE